jgi:hypothetical protein
LCEGGADLVEGRSGAVGFELDCGDPAGLGPQIFERRFRDGHMRGEHEWAPGGLCLLVEGGRETAQDAPVEVSDQRGAEGALGAGLGIERSQVPVGGEQHGGPPDAFRRT